MALLGLLLPLSALQSLVLVVAANAGLLVQISHMAAHGRFPTSRVVRVLQRTHLMLPPRDHRAHHATFDRNFAILTGWSNPLLNLFYTWVVRPRLDPRCDVQLRRGLTVRVRALQKRGARDTSAPVQRRREAPAAAVSARLSSHAVRVRHVPVVRCACVCCRFVVDLHHAYEHSRLTTAFSSWRASKRRWSPCEQYCPPRLLPSCRERSCR